MQPGIEWTQALADISCSALCCHSNETRAPITSLPNSAQPHGTPTIPPSYIRVHIVEMQRGTDRHTDARDQYTFRLGHASRENVISFRVYFMVTFYDLQGCTVC